MRPVSDSSSTGGCYRWRVESSLIIGVEWYESSLSNTYVGPFLPLPGVEHYLFLGKPSGGRLLPWVPTVFFSQARTLQRVPFHTRKSLIFTSLANHIIVIWHFVVALRQYVSVIHTTTHGWGPLVLVSVVIECPEKQTSPLRPLPTPRTR